MAAKKIALFIDADNVSPRFGKQIFDSLTNRGEIFIRRIYGNWEKNILHGWNECILNFALRPVQQPDFVAGKNATDMSLTIDAMDVLYGGQANEFALVSNDSDFTPLAIRLREGGMTVVGFGNEQAASAFRLACSEFIELAATDEVSAPATVDEKPASVVEEKTDGDKIVVFKPQLPPPEKNLPAVVDVQPVKKNLPATVDVQPVEKNLPATVVTSSKIVSNSERQLQSDRDKKLQQIHAVLREAAQVHGDTEGFTPLCWAGQGLHEKNLGFGIKDVGYSSFQKFVAAFPKIYEMIHRTNGENFCYRLITDVRPSAANKLQQIHNILREAAKIHGDATGFADLCYVGSYIAKKNISLNGTGHSKLQNFIAAFPDLYELRTNGFKAFIRLRTNAPKNFDEEKLQRMHDALSEAAKIHGDETGFASLNDVRLAIRDKQFDFSVKDFGYETLREFISAFPKLYETANADSSQLFCYRCR